MRGKKCHPMPSSSVIGTFCGEPPVVFHEDDAPGQCVKVIAAYICAQPYNKGEVARSEADSEAGRLVRPRIARSGMAHYWMTAINPG